MTFLESVAVGLVFAVCLVVVVLWAMECLILIELGHLIAAVFLIIVGLTLIVGTSVWCQRRA